MSRDEISDHCLCDKCSGDDCEGLKEMQERAIRKQERERVLKLVDGLVTSEEIHVGINPNDGDFKESWKRFLRGLESLRQGAQP